MSVLAFLASVAACLSTCPADAGVLVSWSEVGGNFQGVVSGSLTSAELAQAGSNFASTLSDTAFIDTTPTFASYPAGTHLRYNFLASTVAFTPDFIRLNSYVGTSRSGDVFGFYQVANGSLTVTVPSGYQAGTAINGTLTVPAYGNSLSTSFTMGEVIKLNGNALITFSAAAVPEPSTWAMAVAAIACGGVMMRRQRTRACRRRAVHGFAIIVALCQFALPRASDAGTLYVADRVNNVVAAYNGTTGAVINSSFITGLNNPWFMTRDSDGNFYVTNRNSNAVGKYGPDGTVINATFIAASDPMGVAVDNAGRLFLSVGSNVRTYDASTGALINSSFISGLSSPRPLALDGAGNLFVGDYFGSTVGKYDAATGAAVNASLITGFSTPLGLAFDATGKLFVSSVGNPGVQSFDASTGTAISGSRLGGFGNTFGLAFDESNNFFVSRYSDGFMAKLTATGSTVTNPLITLSANGPTSLVYVAAVPEPSTWAMAVAAIACGGFFWRQRKQT